MRSRREIDRSSQALGWVAWPLWLALLDYDRALGVNVWFARVLRPGVGLGRLIVTREQCFQGGLGLGLVWLSPGNNVPRVQGNLNPFGCTLRTRVP